MHFLTTITIVCFFCCYAEPTATTKTWYKPHGRPSGCYQIICNDTATYPETHIRRLLDKKKNAYDDLFGSVIEPSGPIELPSIRSPGLDGEDKNFCETRSVTILPKIAYDDNMNAQFIVNLKGYEQRVTFSTCVESECFAKELPLDYQTSCKQLYNKVRLLYITNKGALEYGSFSVPSTCVCTYSKQRYF